MIVDAHFHLWRIGRNDCTWPTAELAAIHRDFGIDDWQRAAASSGAGAGVLVQSQASARDTDWLLGIAGGDHRIAAVVGWADLSARDAQERVATLAAQPKLRGLRPMLQDLPQDDWILRRELEPAVGAMIAHGLCFDALVKPRHLPHLLEFAHRYPRLRIVIDHAGKPDIARGAFEPWRSQMTELAALPNVFCKLSGLLTEAGGRGSADGLRPCVDHLLQTFGPWRLLWGSDWPVLNLAGAYAEWFRTADVLTGLRGAERAALFGGNAAACYGFACAEARA